MHIPIQPVYFGSIQTDIMIATDENLVRIKKVTKPIHKVNSLLLTSVHGKVPRMYKDVCIGQLREPPMLTVGVGEVEDRLAVHQISLFSINSLNSTSTSWQKYAIIFNEHGLTSTSVPHLADLA